LDEVFTIESPVFPCVAPTWREGRRHYAGPLKVVSRFWCILARLQSPDIDGQNVPTRAESRFLSFRSADAAMILDEVGRITDLGGDAHRWFQAINARCRRDERFQASARWWSRGPMS
jgi:hypothetical protein